METKGLRGVTWVERWIWWWWVPAVLTVVIVCWVLTALHLVIAAGTGGWLWLGLFSGVPGVLVALFLRRVRYALAEWGGPWVIIEALEQPKMYLPGTGYTGYLCRTAGVTPGKVYGKADEVNDAHRKLCEVHNELMLPVLQRGANPVPLRGYDDEQWGHVVNHWGSAANGRPAPFYVMPYYE